MDIYRETFTSNIKMNKHFEMNMSSAIVTLKRCSLRKLHKEGEKQYINFIAIKLVSSILLSYKHGQYLRLANNFCAVNDMMFNESH